MLGKVTAEEDREIADGSGLPFRYRAVVVCLRLLVRGSTKGPIHGPLHLCKTAGVLPPSRLVAAVTIQNLDERSASWVSRKGDWPNVVPCTSSHVR
jgi:hypothetical protein